MIAEQSVFEDLGRIPTLQDWLEDLPFKDWRLRGAHRTARLHRCLPQTQKGGVAAIQRYGICSEPLGSGIGTILETRTGSNQSFRYQPRYL